MNKKLALAVVVVAMGLGWLSLSKRAEPLTAPVSAPTKPVAQAPKQTPPAAQAAVTNIPGIGPVPTDPKELERFKAKSKRELQAALRSVGVFSDRQDQKQAQDSGEMAWIFIEQRKNLSLAMEHILKAAVEPYPPRMLEALEHILKHGEEAQLKLTAATLLYRYGQSAGKEYLLSVLNSPVTDLRTRDVVLTLGLNRDVDAVSGVAAAFPKLGPPSDAVQVALGRWREPSIAQAVREQYAKDPRNWGYALGLSQAHDVSAIAPLAVALKNRSSGSDGYLLQAAMAHLGAIEPLGWKELLETAFQNRARLGERALVRYLDIAGPAVSLGVAQELLQATIPLHEEYLAGMELQAKRARERDPMAYNWYPKPSPYEFIKGAVDLLRQWDAKEAVPTLQQVLLTVQKNNRADVYLNESIGLALYKLDPANWRDSLLNAGVPPYHVDRIPALAQLRPIPPEYLPKQVNLKAR